MAIGQADGRAATAGGVRRATAEGERARGRAARRPARATDALVDRLRHPSRQPLVSGPIGRSMRRTSALDASLTPKHDGGWSLLRRKGPYGNVGPCGRSSPRQHLSLPPAAPGMPSMPIQPSRLLLFLALLSPMACHAGLNVCNSGPVPFLVARAIQTDVSKSLWLPVPTYLKGYFRIDAGKCTYVWDEEMDDSVTWLHFAHVDGSIPDLSGTRIEGLHAAWSDRTFCVGKEAFERQTNDFSSLSRCGPGQSKLPFQVVIGLENKQRLSYELNFGLPSPVPKADPVGNAAAIVYSPSKDLVFISRSLGASASFVQANAECRKSGATDCVAVAELNSRTDQSCYALVTDGSSSVAYAHAYGRSREAAAAAAGRQCVGRGMSECNHRYSLCVAEEQGDTTRYELDVASWTAIAMGYVERPRSDGREYVYGWSERHLTAEKAEKEALEHCRGDDRRPKNCEILKVLDPSICMALALPSGGRQFMLQFGDTRRQAVDDASANCQRLHPRSSCTIAATMCNDRSARLSSPYFPPRGR